MKTILVVIISCFQMFNWICHNRDMFLVNYTEIGMSQKFAVELENEHSQFANSAVVRDLIYMCFYMLMLKVTNSKDHMIEAYGKIF